MSGLTKFFESAAADDEMRTQFRRTSDPQAFARLAVELGQKHGFSFGEDEVLRHIEEDEKAAQALAIGMEVKEIPRVRLALRQWEIRPDVNRQHLKRTL